MDYPYETFPELITRVLRGVNSYPGGNKQFFLRIGKSRSCVSNWKKGKWAPSEDERSRVIAVANEVIKLCEQERVERVNRQAELITEFNNLLGDSKV